MLPQAHSSRPKLQVIGERDVTAGILQIAENIAAVFFPRKIHWETFWDRLDGATLPDGTEIDLGDQYRTPAMDKIKNHIKRIREEEA